MYFVSDVDKLVRMLREIGPGDEKLCELEDSTNWYAQNARETPLNRGVAKGGNFLKDNDILAVPFDRGKGFCVMKKQSNDKKLEKVLECFEF